ncbi:hypothetical protein DH2020_006567 [Rehmannia glutinosa]|uniref:Pathogenesis-related homeodomain protein n=1 Tax=Rehmannia glutinosa TaxID=99300 RepID=A0ABR0XJU0_REHGL
MGHQDNGTQELESNVIEQSKASENLAQDPAGEHLAVDNYKMDCERSVTEAAAQKEVTGAQNTEKKLVSIEARSEIIKETGPIHGEIPQDVGVEKREPQLENVKILSDVEMEVAAQNGLTTLENVSALHGTASVNPDNGNLEPSQINATNDSGHLKNEDIGSSGQSGKRKAKLGGPVTISCLEKLKPEKELQRAKSHILCYKMKIRALFQRLDQSLTVGKLPESLFDSQGEIDCEDIFCAKCGSKDLTLDNDIILCDGACERGYHQFCVEPPLLKEDIPPGDEGWLCPGCDCKVDCIDMLKDFQGTKISVTDSWEAEGDESSSDESDYFSAPDDLATSLPNDQHLGLPSDDSEDDDFDPSAPDEDEQVNQDSSSSDFTSDSEDLGALLEDDNGLGKDLEQISPSPDSKQPSTGSKEDNSGVGRMKRQSLKDELSYLMETTVEPVSGKRHVERLNYKKLHDETYGDSSSDSSDEDFDDTTSRKRRKTDRAKTQVQSPNKTPILNSNMNTMDENQKESKHLPRRTRKKDADGGTSESSAKVGSTCSGTKRSAHKRLGEATTQRLYASFNENQYPERAVKENLAKELGLTLRQVYTHTLGSSCPLIKQVSKWFENARWSFNHRPQMESNSNEKPPVPQPTIGTDNNNSNQDQTTF